MEIVKKVTRKIKKGVSVNILNPKISPDKTVVRESAKFIKNINKNQLALTLFFFKFTYKQKQKCQ